MRRIFCSGLLAGAVLVLGQADIGRAQKENAGKYGWLSNLTQGMQLARQTGKPLMVVFRCEPWGDCRIFDGQVVRLEGIADVAHKFVRVRLVRITGVDLRLFEFDHDLTWAAFLMNAEGKIYGRYGGRDASGPDGRMSKAGLRHAMQKALAAHEQEPTAKPAQTLEGKPVLAENYPAAQKFKNACIHCHQVYEFQRDQLKKEGKWDSEWRWLYPLPENIGITLEVDRGDEVKAVKADSPAAQVGIKPGDVVVSINDMPVGSFADAQYALHKAPAKGEIGIGWKRGGAEMQGKLRLGPGWRKTNVAWRPSLLDILPSVPLYGEDLEPHEKAALKLPAQHLAFRQDKVVALTAKQAGVQAGDVIIGINGLQLEMDMIRFLGYVRQNHLVGDQITLNVIRDGKRLEIPLKLTW